MSPDSVWIPSLGVSVTVLSEGQSDGLASIPVGKTRVGWLNWTPSLTGRVGTTVIAGHVTYDNIPGAFYKLPQIKAGAVVYTTTHTGKVQAWRVQSAATYPKGKLPAAVWATGGAHQLALVTCTGSIGRVPEQGGYAHLDNLVVMTKPVATR